MNAIDVALFYIDLFNKDNKYIITNLKLNKLLYFAQGWYLSKYNEPLFGEQIEAWNLGPVVPSVYQAYKPLGKKHIMIDRDEDSFDESKVSAEQLELLIDVYNYYSKYSANELVDMTHVKDSPWDKVYVKNENKVIPNELIKEYFSTQKKIPSISDIDFSLVDSIGRIDTDGHLILPSNERND